MRRAWRLPPTPYVLWQSHAVGPLLSLLQTIQTAQLGQAALPKRAIFVLGYWRSGTTLLHELLCLDPRFCFPTTEACMNPHGLVFRRGSQSSRPGRVVRRPMDDMVLHRNAPQEDEFALFALGARSPYETLLAPDHLAEALALADPANLSAEERDRWRAIFASFVRAVMLTGGERTLVLKSPPHACRIAELAALMPDSRFILIVREPAMVFESAARMWRRLFEIYSSGRVPGEDAIREAVLTDRPRFERNLAAGAARLSCVNFAAIRYEDLVADPTGVCASLYGRLDLGDFSAVRERFEAEARTRHEYRASNRPPPEAWAARLRAEWKDVFESHRALG